MPHTPPLVLPPIACDPRATTQEQVYLRLRNALMIGAVEPGVTLTIRGLAEYMGLSPTPIREALRRLGSENAIETLGNRRIVVPRMSAGRFDELIRLRVAIEGHAGARALPYVSDVLIEDMAGLDREMDAALRQDRYDALTVLNQQFHRALYTVNPNQSAMPLIESIWLQLGPFQRQVIHAVKTHYLVDRHKQIMDALRRREPAALAAAISDDIQDGIGRSGRAALQTAPPARPASPDTGRQRPIPHPERI
jgi:DNA-binding GntR family transcriptional regulator